MNRVAQKGNAFLKAVVESEDYDFKTASELMELVKVHISEQLANDMLYELLVQSFDEPDNHKIRIIDCGQKFINCIKLVRMFTGFGLKEAKDLCDQVRCGSPQVIKISRHRSDGQQVDIRACRQQFRDEGITIE